MKSPEGKRHFRILSKKTVFRGYVSQLDLLQIETSSGRRVERELIRHPGVAVIVPKLPDGQLILVRQLRIAAGQKIWEFPAGTLERGERTIDCAQRELREETGWKAGRLKAVLEFFPTPGISNEKMYIFFADRMKKVSHPTPDVDEELEVGFFKPRQLERMIRKGEIIDGKTIMGYLFLKRT